jgi:gamma-glutamylcyclotransferase (GGCT)/AIG2-like uncharacterized protein YtfP
VKEVPTIHFDRHLYSALASYRKGKEEIKTVPVKMNKGETDFIKHLREYLISQGDAIKDKEIFILRNLSRRGVGFFIESSSFYPDFIIWVVTEKKQTILFVDPKGILMLGNFKNDKIVFCNETIKEINAAIRQKAKEQKLKLEIELKACILSVTPYTELKASWESSVTAKTDFTKHNVLFLDDSKDYLVNMFDEVFNKKIKLFCYGSNMSSLRLKSSDRCPSAEFHSIAYIEGYKFEFNKKSTKDGGSGKGSITHTGNKNDKVWGVVFLISPDEKKKLDSKEKGYESREVDLQTIDGSLFKANAHIVKEQKDIDKSLLPFDWYKEHCLRGAAQFKLPAEYQEFLRGFKDKPGNEETKKLELAIYSK